MQETTAHKFNTSSRKGMSESSRQVLDRHPYINYENIYGVEEGGDDINARHNSPGINFFQNGMAGDISREPLKKFFSYGK